MYLTLKRKDKNASDILKWKVKRNFKYFETMDKRKLFEISRKKKKDRKF